MNIIKSNALGLIKIIPFNIPLLANLTGQKLILPFYHAISNRNLPHIKHLYPVRSENLFRKDLDFLLKHYKPIDSEELIAIVAGKKKPAVNCFHITFDDGLKEVHEIIAPLLQEKGIASTFFLNSAFVDNKNLFYRYKASLLIEALANKNPGKASIQKIASYFKERKPEDPKNLILSIDYKNRAILDLIANDLEIDFQAYLQKEKPYLSTNQTKELINKGFTIGAHSIDHPEFSSISLDNQIRQAKDSLSFIKEKFNPKRQLFAFPFTDDKVSKNFFEVLYSSTEPLADLSFGTAGIKKDSIPKNIQRIPMEGGSESAKSIIRMQYLYYLCKFPFEKNIIKRQ